jgi:tRNA(Ile)-lysidine synthase
MNPRAVAVAVSGGRDSMALLHCTAHAAAAQGVAVWALHVHHGLQAPADDWAAHVRSTCLRLGRRSLDLAFDMRRLEGGPARGDSVEAWARAARYAALADMARSAGCASVLLAHHREDQAETFLLQALRGGGAAGLAAMPARIEREGVVWCRPWLDRPRAEIEAYVRRHRIRHADDPSNADTRYARNRLRSDVMPALRQAFPDADASLAAAARRAARERAVIDEVIAADLAAVVDSDRLVVSRWVGLSAPRRIEVLRAWLAGCGVPAVSESFLEQLGAALPAAAPARWSVGSVELRRYRGLLTAGPVPVVTQGLGLASGATQPVPAHIDRAGLYPVPGSQASLKALATRAAGVPLDVLMDARWAPRTAGMRFQAGPGRPPRSLKKQFQAAGVPAWSRTAPVLLAADGSLLFVPGLGTDARALRNSGGARVTLGWVAGHR